MNRLSLRMTPEDRRRFDELTLPDEKDQFIRRRYRMLQMSDMLRPYPALRPWFFQLAALRRSDDPRRGLYPRRGGRDSERGGPNGQRPFQPPGPPRGFPPGDKNKPGDKNRPGDRRPENRK